jgi:hypothetical protein
VTVILELVLAQYGVKCGVHLADSGQGAVFEHSDVTTYCIEEGISFWSVDFEECSNTGMSVTTNLDYRKANISREFLYEHNNYKLFNL